MIREVGAPASDGKPAEGQKSHVEGRKSCCKACPGSRGRAERELGNHSHDSHTGALNHVLGVFIPFHRNKVREVKSPVPGCTLPGAEQEFGLLVF